MEYLGLDVPIVTNVNYIGSDLRSPGNLILTDHAGVWTVNKSGYRGVKKSKFDTLGLPPVSYGFFSFLLSGRIPFNITIIMFSGRHRVLTSHEFVILLLK